MMKERQELMYKITKYVYYPDMMSCLLFKPFDFEYTSNRMPKLNSIVVSGLNQNVFVAHLTLVALLM